MAAVVTTPVDVVKTRIMLSAVDGGGGSSGASISSKTSTSSSSSSSTSTWSTARAIARREGLRALWRGGALRAVWTALGSGLYLAAYETGRVYLEERRTLRHDDDDD